MGFRLRGGRLWRWAIAAMAIVVVLNVGGGPLGSLGGAWAQAQGPTTPLEPDIPRWQVTVDTLWTLIAGMLVVFMNAGFAMLETGFCRYKNAVNMLAKI